MHSSVAHSPASSASAASSAMATTMMASSSTLVQAPATQRSSVAGTSLRQPARPSIRGSRQVARAESDTKEKKEDKKPFSPPTLDSSWPSPIFGGSTGGLMRKAQVLPMRFQPCFMQLSCWLDVLHAVGNGRLSNLLGSTRPGFKPIPSVDLRRYSSQAAVSSRQ